VTGKSRRAFVLPDHFLVMPIKFRCPNCQQFLGISRAKAGLITDCPTCGRTIRVPNLDGTVEPLPGLKMDLADEGLNQALAALANLSQPQVSSNQSGSGSSDAHTPPQQVSVVEEKPPVSVPVAVAMEAVAIEPVAIASVEDAPAQESGAEANPLDVLKQLASEPAPQTKPDISPSRQPLGPGMMLILSIILMACGGLIGRALFPMRVETPQSKAAANQKSHVAKADAQPAPVEQGSVPVSGVITYETPNGDTKPDKDARVILLPLERVGSSLLPPNGFRVNADVVDEELLEAAVRALGGRFVTADASGAFATSLPLEGRYGVLMASQHLARDDSFAPPDHVQAFINMYFERPNLLLGKVQYHYEVVTGAVDTQVELAHHFKVQ